MLLLPLRFLSRTGFLSPEDTGDAVSQLPRELHQVQLSRAGGGGLGTFPEAAFLTIQVTREAGDRSLFTGSSTSHTNPPPGSGFCGCISGMYRRLWGLTGGRGSLPEGVSTKKVTT